MVSLSTEHEQSVTFAAPNHFENLATGDVNWVLDAPSRPPDVRQRGPEMRRDDSLDDGGHCLPTAHD